MDELLIEDRNFYLNLLQIDQELASETREKGCPHCGGVLHSANYPRVPKGLSGLIDIHQVVRFSFCCSVDGCRRRTTSPSVRFLGRKHYLGVLVLMLCAVSQQEEQRTSQQLRTPVGPHNKTRRRWLAWWQKIVPGTPFWAYAKGLIMPPLNTETLCSGLVELFSTNHERSGLYKLLRFISPLSSVQIQFQVHGN
jgi:hypothetical protein